MLNSLESRTIAQRLNRYLHTSAPEYRLKSPINRFWAASPAHSQPPGTQQAIRHTRLHATRARAQRHSRRSQRAQHHSSHRATSARHWARTSRHDSTRQQAPQRTPSHDEKKPALGWCCL